jgi:hypothetical protein
MAKQQDPLPTSEEYAGSVFYDTEGNEVFRVGTIRRDYDSDIERNETLNENVECGDGTFFNQTLMLRAGADRILLERCDECDRQARSSIFRHNNTKMVFSPSSTMRRCWSCRANLCSRHYVLSDDNHIRCERCDNRHFWRKLLTSILNFICFKQA